MNLYHCEDSNENFCKALKISEENAKIMLNNYLKTIDKAKDENYQFQKIKAYFLKQDCIEKVEFGKGYLRTFPPIKQVFLTTNLDQKYRNITVNITLSNSKLNAEKIIINPNL
jgi:hypothetical protein